MQTFAKLIVPATLGCLSFVHGQQLTFNYFGIDAPVRDRDPSGLVNSQTINVSPDWRITDLNVTLGITGTGLGGFNGDLFVTLQHEGGFAVLLNRTGARSGFPSGYSDSGLAVTFDDSALGDIHSYRKVLSGDDLTPVSGRVTGTWAPDGRNVDPGMVLDTTPRTDLLGSFQGEPLNGTWTLFVSDLGTGGTHQLDGWSLQASVTVVPEPSAWALVLFAGAAVLLLPRRVIRG